MGESLYKRYVPGYIPPEEIGSESWWFVFNTGKLLVEAEGEKVYIPRAKAVQDLGINPVCRHYLGTFSGNPCFAVEADTTDVTTPGMEFREFRPLNNALEEDVFLLAGRALQVVNWDKNHKFCGRCGTRTKVKQDERAKICPECGFIMYPRLSPAIIVAVSREEKILLAHSKNFRNNMYSVIAGFVEPGETFEDCIRREVMEEVGIRVKNLSYFGSQPWPFPDSLMVAFTAEYESGEIKVDGVEIADAGWYGRDNLPQVPLQTSIAGRLIRWFSEK